MKGIIITLFFIISSCSAQPKIEEGWEYWNNAEFSQAENIAQKHIDSDEGRHLQGNIHYVNGKYEEAIEVYDNISSEYDKYQKILINKNDIYFTHLKDLALAKKLTDEIQEDKYKLYSLATEKSIELLSTGTYIVPMQTDHPLNSYIPMVKATINGKQQVMAFDTGGNYLIMPKSIAEDLGIKYDSTMFMEGRQGFSTSKMWIGTAEELILGDEVIIRNVPVTILEKMNTEIIIFGTSILKEFLTTIDYPNNQFVFTAASNRDLIDKHLKDYEGHKMDFVMWGDHYMMGNGTYNGQKVNMFFDSGLVVVGQVNGKISQSWLAMTKENMELLNIAEKDSTASRSITSTDDTLEFAGTIHENVVLSLGPEEGFKFGGIECQLLISHGIIKNYAWTINFDEMEYMFK